MDELQQQIIGKLHVKPEINPEEETRELIDFLKKYVGKYTFIKSFVLGISGGQDSTLLGKIAQLAVDELNEEGHDIKFYGVRLPYGEQRDEDDAKDAMDFISPSVETVINIKPAVDAGVQALSDSGYVLSDFVKGNEKARERMKVQYGIAAHTGGVVLGTDHAAEALTGFYTKYGDGAADLAPLTGLNKRQGREIMKYLGASAHLYEKIPTADLEDDKPLLSDEEALGVTYEHIDDFLEGKSVPDEAYDRIKTLYYQSQHKRDLPYNRYNLPV